MDMKYILLFSPQVISISFLNAKIKEIKRDLHDTHIYTIQGAYRTI